MFCMFDRTCESTRLTQKSRSYRIDSLMVNRYISNGQQLLEVHHKDTFTMSVATGLRMSKWITVHTKTPFVELTRCLFDLFYVHLFPAGHKGVLHVFVKHRGNLPGCKTHQAANWLKPPGQLVCCSWWDTPVCRWSTGCRGRWARAVWSWRARCPMTMSHARTRRVALTCRYLWLAESSSRCPWMTGWAACNPPPGALFCPCCCLPAPAACCLRRSRVHTAAVCATASAHELRHYCCSSAAAGEETRTPLCSARCSGLSS